VSPLLSKIAVDPKLCAGKPCIRGTRILVSVLLDALEEGLTPNEVAVQYPPLTTEDVRAAIAYAAKVIREEETTELRASG
jgi:uncharacterized protein (DUF433 family)